MASSTRNVLAVQYETGDIEIVLRSWFDQENSIIRVPNDVKMIHRLFLGNAKPKADWDSITATQINSYVSLEQARSAVSKVGTYRETPNLTGSEAEDRGLGKRRKYQTEKGAAYHGGFQKPRKDSSASSASEHSAHLTKDVDERKSSTPKTKSKTNTPSSSSTSGSPGSDSFRSGSDDEEIPDAPVMTSTQLFDAYSQDMFNSCGSDDCRPADAETQKVPVMEKVISLRRAQQQSIDSPNEGVNDRGITTPSGVSVSKPTQEIVPRSCASGARKPNGTRDVTRLDSPNGAASKQNDPITRSDLDHAVGKILKVLQTRNISGEKGALAGMLSCFTVETRNAQRVLHEMRTEQEIMKTQIKMLLEERQSGGKDGGRSVERARAVSKIIPLNSKREFEEIQAQLSQDSKLQEELITELHTAGGSSGVECLKLMLRKLFTKEFSRQVTFKGRGENLALQNTPLGRSIIGASKTCKHPLSEKEIILKTGELLRREKDSGKGSKTLDSTTS